MFRARGLLLALLLTASLAQVHAARAIVQPEAEPDTTYADDTADTTQLGEEPTVSAAADDSAAGGSDASTQGSPVKASDLLVTFGTYARNLFLVEASRVWRMGIRTHVSGRAAGVQHGLSACRQTSSED
jgi:hypothetical protein